MEKEYDLEFFHRSGFQRRRCTSCGRYFWTLGDQTLCGETPCVEYSFIGASPMGKHLSLSAMRETFLSFFEVRGHPRVRRYPIVARWRDDVFFTQASIYPFQPYVIEGLVKPPANPLSISQPCVRFNDLDNVGKTGRHFSLFEMMAHHVFNYPDHFIYFKDRTTELCQEFFTSELGTDPKELTYVEAWWEGGGNSGPCLEVILRGLEVATLVFMMYRDEDGNRVPMGTQVVDTGYGLERITWSSQGTPSAYEAVFGGVLVHLKGVAGVEVDPVILAEYSRVAGSMAVESHGDLRLLRERVAQRVDLPVEDLVRRMVPLEHLYTICDHTRALTLLLNDGVVPSNVKEGYFARLLVRRSLRSLDALGLPVKLADIVAMQVDQFKADFPELLEGRESILRLVEVEEGKYRETLAKGRGIVREVEARGGGLGTSELLELYDSHGLTPEVVREFASGPVEIPDDFFARVAQRHLARETPRILPMSLPSNLPKTKLLFYRYPRKFDFRAKVLALVGNGVVLDQTCFYPEGGGQEADHGTLDGGRVVDVRMVGGVVVHVTDGSPQLKVNGRAVGHVEGERRMSLMRHHTATHILNGAARKLLGRHVWQTGAHKAEDKATLDITHYEGLSPEQLAKIEDIANDIVLADIPVRKLILERDEAEARFGFSLYQGGTVPGKEIRVVEIDAFDVEACGGTHTERTGEVGLIKLLRSRRIQDGVVRLEYVAGKPAVALVREQARILQAAAEVLNTIPEALPEAAEKLLAEERHLAREREHLQAERIEEKVEELLAAGEVIQGVRLVVHSMEGDMKDLMAVSARVTSHDRTAFVGGAQGRTASLVISTSPDVNIPAVEIGRRAAQTLGGSAGGKPTFVQGGGPRIEALGKALEAAAREVREALGGSRPTSPGAVTPP